MQSRSVYSFFRRPARLIVFCILILSGQITQSALSSVFRFHLLTEPSSLRPAEQRSANSNYFLSQIYATLLSYRANQLTGSLAEECKYTNSKTLECRLRKDLKWSDGSPIEGKAFVKAMQEFVLPENRALRADLLFPVKNAKEIYQGKKKPETLGVVLKNKNILVFNLHSADREFIYNLTSPLLTPTPANGFLPGKTVEKRITSGPFKLVEWKTSGIQLAPNPEYWEKNLDRPQIEVLFIAEDSVALSLYEKKELSFLRRLPTLFIPKYKDSVEYHEIPQLRFDYIGFSKELKDHPQLRKVLSTALSYDELQKLFHARPRPGCPGLHSGLSLTSPCVDYQANSDQLKAALAKEKPFTGKLTYAFSKQGGEDHKRAAEWAQGQWKKNAGLTVELQQTDNKIFLEQLAKNPAPLFRKGNSPERPTCLSALEAFETGNPEDFLQLDSPELQRTFKQLRQASSEIQRKKLCSQALIFLINNNWLIPQGPIHFTILAKSEWQGWDLNELNQLDLSLLKFQPR